MTVTLSDTGEIAFGAQLRWTADSEDILAKIGWHGEEQICRIPRSGGR